jgi:ribonuclease HIII
MPVPRVVKVNVERLDAFLSTLKSQPSLILEQPSNRYEKFRARRGSNLIVAYTTGKIVYDDDPAIQKAVAEGFRELSLDESFEVLVGSDEAGKGEWLGPMVVAAVALDKESVPVLQAEGVMDSKLLDVSRIRELADTIPKLSMAVQTTLVSPTRFNELFAELKAEQKGLNKMLAWAHRTVLQAVLNEEILARGSVRVVVDEFDKFWSRAEFEKLTGRRRIQLELRPRAEENVAVAAASIVARAAREEWIDQKSRELGIGLRGMTSQEIAPQSWAAQVAKISYIRKTASET